MLTTRQQEIIKAIIKEYIRSAEPVSSKFLEKEYDFGIRGAMIRREMQRLTEQGYLFQPHTSAGRIPTAKSYRFIVDTILKDHLEKAKNTEFGVEMPALSSEEMLHLMQTLTSKIAELTSSFAISYIPFCNLSLKEGWAEIFNQPEFENKELIKNFTEFIEELQEYIINLEIPNEINIYIGQEHPFGKGDEFSTILTNYHFSKNEKSLIAIVGPMRMDYEENIKILESLPSLILELIN